MVRRMRKILLAMLALLLPAGLAWAAKPPPLGADETTAAGKPPPLGGASAPSTRPPPEGRVAETGSGFVVGDGHVLTNFHVVEGCNRLAARKTSAGKRPAFRLGWSRCPIA